MNLAHFRHLLKIEIRYKQQLLIKYLLRKKPQIDVVPRIPT